MTGQRGRPRTGTPVLVRIPADLLKQIDEEAVKEGISRSQLIRQILTYAVRP
jgi:metal-responsive CopG/Arc/MetJ family transcriptional regulator